MTQKQFLVNINDKENQVNDFTINYKEYDYKKIIDILAIISKSIEVIPEIVYDKIELLDDEYQIEKNMINIPIENSRLMKIRIYYKIVDEEGNIRIDDKTNKEIRPTIDLFIPRLIDGTFILYDVPYYCMLQVLDYKSIIRENSSIVKTLINKLRIEVKRNRRRNYKVELDLFRRKDVPIWLVLFSLYNPREAIERVFKTDNITIEDNNREVDNDKYELQFGNKILSFVDLENIIEKNRNINYRLQVMFESLKEFMIDIEKIKNKDFVDNKDNLIESRDVFISILGSYYTSNTNKYLSKGKNVCHSLSRFLDDITKSYMEVDDMLDMFMKELDKINAYNENIKNGDIEAIESNMSNNLLNKRVRMSEFIVFPFTKKLSENMHVILNSNTKENNKIGKILNIFKIDSNIIIKYILQSTMTRFNDQVNLMTAIFKSKASFVTSDNSNNISDDMRSIPKSGVGRIDFITTSNGQNCGLHFNLSATNKKLFDERGIII